MKKFAKSLFGSLIMTLILTFALAVPVKASLFCPDEMTDGEYCDCYYRQTETTHYYWCSQHDKQATEPENHYDEDNDGYCDPCGYNLNGNPGGDGEDPDAGGGNSGEISEEIEAYLSQEIVPFCIESSIEMGVEIFDYSVSEDGTCIELSYSDILTAIITENCVKTLYELGYEDVSIPSSVYEVGSISLELDFVSADYTGSEVEPGVSVSYNLNEFLAYLIQYEEPVYSDNVEVGTGIASIAFYVQDGSSFLVELEFEILGDSGDETNPPEEPEKMEGWKSNEIGIWYQYADGTYPKNQWAFIEGCYYYFDASGYRITGWVKSAGKWYYLDPEMIAGGIFDLPDGERYAFDDNGAMVTGWYSVGSGTDKIWYYALPGGNFAEGWQKVGTTWYYFDPDNNIMYADLILEIGGATYRFDANGAMITGWYKDVFGDGSCTWYYFMPNGQSATGWNKIGNVWYYFEPDNGSMYADGLYFIEEGDRSVLYCFDSSGAMLTGWYKPNNEDDSDIWYYFKSSGELATGWQAINNKWYYFEDNGAMVYDQMLWLEGENEDDYDLYCFDKSGAMVTGWYKFLYEPDEETGEVYYEWYYFTSNGAVEGWQKINNKWYYFEEGSYYMYYDSWLWDEEKEVYYYLDHNGAMVTGWYNAYEFEFVDCEGNTVNLVDWIYMNPDGTSYNGWLKSGANWYYIDEGSMIYFDTVYVGDKVYYFAPNGTLATKTGWNKIVGRNVGWVYVANASGELLTGWKTIGGVEYYFTPSYEYYYDDNTGKEYSFAAGEMLYSCTLFIDEYICTFDENGKCIERVPAEA